MIKTITFTNQKGGIGKTTTTASVAGGLAKLGYRVLAIDLDPQGNLSFSMGADFEDSPTVYDLFKGNATVREIIQKTNICDLMPSNILMSSADIEFVRPGREYLLREALAEVQHEYDYIVIDTPPALSLLTLNAFSASTDVVIPMLPEILSLQGISLLNSTIETIKKFYCPNIRISGILFTRYNPRAALTKDVEEMVDIMSEKLDTKVFKTRIRQCVSVAEAPAHCTSIMDYAPKSKAAQDYMTFVKELIGETS